MKMKLLLTTLGIALTLTTNAQEKKTYVGAYSNGYAEYGYTENENMLRLWDGRFSYKDTLEIASRGEVDVLMSGAYKADKKAAVWVATLKGLDGNTLETATGPFKDGMKTGFWTHRLTVGDKDVKVATASFNQNTFRAKFDYSYTPDPESVFGPYQNLKVSGSFDNAGMLDGTWTLDYTNKEGVVMKEVMRYQHGVLAFKVVQEAATGKELERFDDKEAMVTKFWEGLNRPDSNATVDGTKYWVLRKMVSHPILTPLFKAWNDLRTVNISNQYASSIPTMLIEHGELSDNKYLKCEQEIVLWMETPKGHKEWLEEQRILEEYKSTIKKAEAALEAKNLEESLKHYRLASTIKKDEAYPREQIPVIEKMIVDRDTKNRLLKSIEEKANTLESTQKKMMGNETFEKKQDKLYEAYDIAYSTEYRSMKSAHSKVRAFIENDNIEAIEIPELEAYETELKSLLDIQTKVKALIGKETKDLEKELKKMDDPSLISKRLRQ
ncbi:MAG: hypothetical protein Salg2KO_17870 [Salibacteraceae bacterium]